MNKDFPRIITLLRKENGLSQKQVALDLDISQALLSHYEKGIRECGLDFVVKIAKYYNVSCDYLLGVAAEKNGTMISVENIPDPDSTKDNVFKGSVLPTLNKKLIFNSINVIFDLLQKINNKSLITQISNYLMLTVYGAFRSIYSANTKNPQEIFKINNNVYTTLLNATTLITENDIKNTLKKSSRRKKDNYDSQKNLNLNPKIISSEYPLYASSLYNLIQTCEANINSKIKI